MTTLGELSQKLELNPDAPYPPFPVYLSVPKTWTILDTNPSTWERSAQQMIDTTFHGSRVTGKERRQIISFFDGLVAECQQAGAALSLLQVGRLREGVAASLGIHIAFVDEGSESSVGRIRDSLPRTGTVTEVATAVGPGVQRVERSTFMPPGSGTLVGMTSIQIFVPISGTNWTVVFATASAYPELTDPVTTLLQRIAGSVALDENTDENTGGSRADRADQQGSAGDEADDDFEETSTVRGPGIERGFGTLVRKRVGSGSAGAASAGDDALGSADDGAAESAAGADEADGS